jgi:hypothetical protein
MNNIKLYFTQFLAGLCLVLLCTGLMGSIAHSLPPMNPEIKGQLVARSVSKQELAQTVLVNIGIAKQYDMYFDHAVGILVTSNNVKFKSGLRAMMAREAGWKKTQKDYVTQLTTDFSIGELQELLRLSKRPLLQRLLRSEIQVYNETSPKRHQLLNEVWENYNEGKITLPK